MSRLGSIRSSLRAALAVFTSKHQAGRAARAKAGLDALRPPAKVTKPTPPAKPTATPAVDKVIAAIRGEIGYHEGRAGGHWNNIEKFAAQVPGLGWAQGQAWCDVFACWGFLQGGLTSGTDFPLSASCDLSAAGYKKTGRWSEYPAIGAQIFYGTPSNLVHTGIVVGYGPTTVTTVEGNTNDNGSPEGDGVYLKTHQRASSYVVGYGYPKYPEGIKSADPKFR